MLGDDDSFDIEDVDFSCFNDQNVSNVVSSKHSSLATSPQKKIMKKHALDLVHSLVDESPSNIINVPLGYGNVQNLGRNNNKSPRNVQVSKRRFPGPAGLLPEKVNFQSTANSDCDLSSRSGLNISRDKCEIEQASSQYGSIFETLAWKRAVQDIELCGFSGIQSCNISHLKRCAFSSKSKALKYPFLVLAVTNMNTGQELFVTLSDSSGEIQAHINSDVLEQYPMELSRGCVIVLKKVGVLKTGQARGLSLLITPNNLAVIYPPDSGASKLSILKDSCQDIDFLNLDVSLNTSLDTSLINISCEQSTNLHRTPLSRLERGNKISHSTPNYSQKKQCASIINISSRTSTPKVQSMRLVSQQPLSSNHILPVRPYSTCDREPMSTSQPSSNMSSETNNALLENKNSNLLHNKPDKKLDRSITVSVLSQNGINQGEDLSSTMNSLFEGLDTDSIFDDF